MMKKLAIALHCDDDEDREALMAHLPTELTVQAVPGLRVNMLFGAPADDTLIIGRLKIGKEGVSWMAPQIDELPDDRKTIELHGDKIVVSTHVHDNWIESHAFPLSAVKVPPGKRLVVVSDEDAP